MNKELELEAKKHLDKHHNNEDIAYPELYDQYNSFVAGATSKYVEKQKLEFAIEQLKYLEPTDYDVEYGSSDLRRFRNELRKKIIEFKQRLSEL